MKIIIPLLRGSYLIKEIEDIKYFYIDKGVVFLRDTDDGAFASSKPLHFFKDLLADQCFFQINRSHLLNLRRMEKIDGVSKQVHLSCGITLDISRNSLRAIRDQFQEMDYILKW